MVLHQMVAWRRFYEHPLLLCPEEVIFAELVENKERGG